MRAFTMNLLQYNADAAFQLGQAPTNKQQLLSAELANYSNNVINATPVNIAGFTEVNVANNALQGNVENALNDLSNSLNIPQDNLGNRHIAVIRCGYTALQPNTPEVVAVVVDGNANIINYYIDWFVPPQGLQPGDYRTPIQPALVGNYTASLQSIQGWTADYRYIVGVEFSLVGINYNVAFFHNRQPGVAEQGVAMSFARRTLGNFQNANMLLGGDFNTTPLCAFNNPCVAGYHPHTQRTYYSIGANTTVANNYDWWISAHTLNNGLVNAQCDATPSFPGALLTGSDHRGVGIEIT